MEAALGIISPQKITTRIPPAVTIVGEDGLRILAPKQKPSDSPEPVTLARGEDLSRLAQQDPKLLRKLDIKSSLPVLSGFVAYYNEVATECELDPLPKQIDSSTIRSKIEDSLHHYADDPDNESLSSPFIIGLRYLLEEMIKQPL
jgi:hypothetical protein